MTRKSSTEKIGMKKSFLILAFFILASANVLAQYLPDGIFPGIDTIDVSIGDGEMTGPAWNIYGNTITYTTPTLGTKNAYSIHMMTNNINRMIIDTLGNVGIGTDNPQARLAVDGIILSKGVKINATPPYWPDYVFSLTMN